MANANGYLIGLGYIVLPLNAMLPSVDKTETEQHTQICTHTFCTHSLQSASARLGETKKDKQLHHQMEYNKIVIWKNKNMPDCLTNICVCALDFSCLVSK